MKSLRIIMICSIIGLMFSIAQGAVLYSDDFNSDTSANYDVLKVADSATLDAQATFAYDYSADGIPPAPNGTGTLGLKLEVNNGDATAERAAINVYPKGQSFADNYILKFDMWINYPTACSSGTTEYAIWGINCSGTKANADPTIINATDTDGYFWGITGEGGSARDSRSYEGVPGSPAIDLAPPEPGFIDDADNNWDTLYQNLFPSPPYDTPGSPGNHWVEVKMVYRYGNYKVYLNDTLVYNRTDDTYSSGNIMLGAQDIFTSISCDTTKSFVIFDNLVVEEGPASLSANNWELYQ